MPEIPQNRRFRVALLHAALLSALALPYCLHLGSSSLWDANESFYAETPREMLESGNYLAPTFNFQPRAQKPPLTYWAVLVSYKIFGVKEFSVRVPGAAAAIGVLLFVYGMGRILFSPAAGLMGAAICATTPRFFVLCRKLPIDALLLFWLTGTAYFLIRGITTRSRSSWLAAYIFAGLGFMTKGPIAVVIPAGAWVLWALWARRFSLRGTFLLPGAALFAAITLPWYAAIYATHGWTYIASFFLRDNLGRFAAESFGPSRGPFYYAPIFLADFFPWSLLSLAALWQVWRAKRKGTPLFSAETGFPFFWSGLVFLLFSLSKNKQEYYIAALYPLMAVLLGGVLERVLLTRLLPDGEPANGRTGHESPGTQVWAWVLATAALVIFSISLVAVFALRAILADYPRVLHYSAPAILLIGTLVMAWTMIRLRLDRCILILTAALWGLFLLAPVVYLPALEPFRPVRDLCAVIRGQMHPGDTAGYFRATVPSMVFYLRKPIFEEFDADSMVRRFQSKERVFCIMSEQDENYFVGSRDQILYILDRRVRLVTRLRGLFDQSSWADQELVLVSNRPPAETAEPAGRGVQ
jgi:4-amino-4-deoxy-L-arabinose transferase-like glycosyltransferase